MKSEFDACANSYAELVNRALPLGAGGVEKFADVKAWHLRRELIRRKLPLDSTKILDVGCGIGLTDTFLKRFCPQVTGLDISEQSIALARERNPELEYRIFDGGEFPFPEMHFDVVFAICVVHHIPPSERPLFFSKLFRVLKPGGTLAIYEHNPLNPVTRWIVSRCEFDRGVVLLTASECEIFAKDANFQECRLKFFGFSPLQQNVFRHIEERLLSIFPAGAQYQLSATRAQL